MLRYLPINNKSSLKKLALILENRKLKQKNKSAAVKTILENVKKFGDKAVVKYETKFSKV